jgi:replicative DNA helicase
MQTNNDTEKLKRYSLKEYILSVAGGKAENIGGDKVRIEPCPVCKHKEHFTIYESTNTYSSFNECCKGGDILNFEQEYFKQNFKEALESLKKRFNIQDEFTPATDTKRAEKKQEIANKPEEQPEPKKDYSSLIEQWSKNARNTDYFTNRGLTAETIEKFRLGYNESGNFYSSNYKYSIPISNNCVAFRVEGDFKPRYRNTKGEVEVLNTKHIADKEARTVFIVEGAFDCMSIEQQGFNAIALNSTSNIDKLIELLKKHRQEQEEKQYIFIPDTDSAGQKFINKIENAFNELNISLYVEQLPEGAGKDCNDYLLKNNSEFKSFLEFATEFATDRAEDRESGYLKDFLIQTLDENKREKPTPTGFLKLDKTLNGGLYAGLYAIGGVSSLGKTALTLHIADNIAGAGNDIIFFSLEMSKKELTARSISKQLLINALEKKKISLDKINNVGTRAILNGDIRHLGSQYAEAFKDYEPTARRKIIKEGNFETDINEIKETVQKHIQRTNKKPVVIVDYLQIIKGLERKTTKESTDYIVSELKRLSRTFNIPVVAVSSFNRGSYTSPVGYESFKESGGIEYGADVLIGLELSVLKELEFKKGNEQINRTKLDEAKREQARRVDAVILKNRNGEPNDRIPFLFYPINNYFREA